MRGRSEKNTPTMKTTYQGITIHLSPHTYQPAEDTYLLLDACLKHIKDNDTVLEIGSGSGIISTILKHRKHINITATDINPHAVRCTRANNIPVIRTNLFQGIKAKFDVIIFNPPYLPTSKDEKIPGWLNYAFDGGTDGTATITRFLEQAPRYLKPKGKILIVISSLANTEKITNKMQQIGYITNIEASEKYFFETLTVIKGELNQKTNTKK
jgi:release factor glutamine methyltransferase